MTDYAEDLAAVPAAQGRARDKALEALDKKVRLDLEALEELGFGIDDLAPAGAESRLVLRPTPWRLPLDLDDPEQAMLTWIMSAPGAAAGLASGEPDQAPSYDALLGSLPGGLGLVHAALAGRRSLLVDVGEAEKVVEPARLASYQGRWFLLVRFPGSEQVYGYRLDRLEVLALGDPLPAAPVRVDPLEVLDPTAWRRHPPEDVELRCQLADVDAVASWFPRATHAVQGDEVALRFECSHREALLDRVVGLAGAGRLVAPDDAVLQLRERLLAVVEAQA